MNRRLGRRSFLGLTAGAAAGAALPGLLAACRNGGGEADNRLVISNWPLYIDPSRPGHPGTVQRFEQASGIRVAYSEDQNDSAAFFAKIRPDLAAGRPIPQDVFITPYWLASRMIRLGWLEALPLAEIPNAARLEPQLRHPSWDPSGRFSLPWQSGIAGIAYNREVTGRDLTGIDDLYSPDLRGRVGFLTEMRDTMGLLMLAEGQNPAQPTMAKAESAFRRLEKAKAAGQIRAFTGNNYQSDLLAGNFAACMAWSGDVAQLAQDNPKLRFIVPASGGILWADVMVVPKRTPHLRQAAAWMNFVYDPAQAARITAEVQYISPVQGVQQLLAKDPATAALAANPLVFPNAAMRARLHTFGPLSEADEIAFDERFAAVSQA